MTWYKCFIETLVIACAVYEILAQIDQIGPFWPWKLHLEWFHTFHILWSDRISLLLNNINNHGKMGQTWLSDLEIDLLNNSIKSISWQLINIISKKLYAKDKEKLSDHFWKNCQTVEKYQNLIFSDLLDHAKIPLELFNKIHLLAIHQHPTWEASCQNREAVMKQFLRKLPPREKLDKFDLSYL